MAKQEAIIPLRGTIGKLNFYQKNGEFRVRRKGGVDKQRILNDPKFARTRENMEQFKIVAADLKIFTKAIANLKSKVSGKVKLGPLSSLFYKVAQLDNTSQRGNKQISIGIKQEQGIAMFRARPLTTASVGNILNVPLQINRTTAEVSSEEFIPQTQMNYPKTATHFEMQSAVVAINFTTKVAEVSYSTPLIAAIDDNPISLSLEPSTLPDLGEDTTYFVMLVVLYFQQDNGNLYQLNASNFVSLDILDAYNS